MDELYEVLGIKLEAVVDESAKKNIEDYIKRIRELYTEKAKLELQKVEASFPQPSHIGEWGQLSKKIKAATARIEEYGKAAQEIYNNNISQMAAAKSSIQAPVVTDVKLGDIVKKENEGSLGKLTEKAKKLKDDGDEIRKTFVQITAETTKIYTLVNGIVSQIKEVPAVSLGKEVTEVQGHIKKQTDDSIKGIKTIKSEYQEAGKLITKLYQQTSDGKLFETKSTEEEIIEKVKNLGKEVTEGFSNIAIGEKIGEGSIISVDTNELENTKKITTEILKNGVRIRQIFTQDLTTGKLYEQTKKETKEQEKLKKTLATQFKDRLKRIGSYKIIAMLFRSIINMFKQGFQYLSNYDALQDSLSGLKATTIGISTSIASLLTPALQALNVALKPLSDTFVNFANRQAQAQAILKGEAEYYKISTAAIEDYAKSLQEANGQLTQLDKFATLQGNKPMIGKMVDVGENPLTDWFTGEDNELNSEFIRLLEEKLPIIGQLFKDIGGVIAWVVGKITDLYANFQKLGITGKDLFLGLVGVISLFSGKLGFLVTIFTSLVTLFDKEASPAAKVLASGLLAAATAMAAFAVYSAFAKSAVLGWITLTGVLAAGTALGVFAGVSANYTPPSTGSVSTPSYTNGYDYINGRMYNANETAMGSIERNTEATASGRGEALVVNTELNIDGTSFAKATTKAIVHEAKTAGYSI